MKLILFSKMFKDMAVGELVSLAGQLGIDGYDLCVRPGYPVCPENAGKELPETCRHLRENGFDVPMVTGHFDVLYPDAEKVGPLLAAMDKAGVRLLKLGYFRFEAACEDYLGNVREIRTVLAGWQKLGAEHGVKILYHTHSGACMGLNAAALAHLLEGLDPTRVGAYLDTGHLVAEGENFSTAVGMVRPYLSVVALKDMLLKRVERNGHGGVKPCVVEAGKGMVDWTGVFACLGQEGFNGPLSVHCEFLEAQKDRIGLAKREVAFFRSFMTSNDMTEVRKP